MPARQRPPRSAPSTAVPVPRQPSGNEDDSSDVEAEAVPMPRNVAPLHVKRYQALLICVAHSEVRASGTGGTLSTKEQETLLEQSYKRHCRLWYQDDANLVRSPNFPVCSASMKSVGSVKRFVKMMLNSTGTGERQLNGPSLLRKYKEIIKKGMLKLIADWNMLCGRTFGSAIIGKPPTGVTNVAMYQRLVRTTYRREETNRVLKLRIACRNVEFGNANLCTDEGIREARISYHYATRGFTKTDQDADKRVYDRLATMRDVQRDRALARYTPIRDQVLASVDADETLERQNQNATSNANDEADSRAPPSASSTQSFTELPMPEQYDLELGLVFKVFGPYEGPNHMSPFWTEAWNEHRAMTSFPGRQTTQHRQASQNEALRSGVQPSAFPGTTPASIGASCVATRPLATIAAGKESREAQRASALTIYTSMLQQKRQKNALESFRISEALRQQQIDNLNLAITMASSLGVDYPPLSPTITAMRLQILQLLQEKHAIPELPEADETHTAMGTNNAAISNGSNRNVRRRQNNQETIDLTTDGVASITSSDQPQNDRCLQDLLDDMYERFTVKECGSLGNCAFCVMNALEHHDVPHEMLALANVDNTGDNNSFTATRTRIMDHLEASFFFDAENPSDPPQSTIRIYGADIVTDLLDECGTVQEYVSIMRQEGTYGGLNEFAIWTDLMKVRVTIHSTSAAVSINNNRMHVEVMGPATYGDEVTPMYHVLHLAGYGGRGTKTQACKLLHGNAVDCSCFAHAFHRWSLSIVRANFAP
jgi:hypothetical protein